MRGNTQVRDEVPITPYVRRKRNLPLLYSSDSYADDLPVCSVHMSRYGQLKTTKFDFDIVLGRKPVGK